MEEQYLGENPEVNETSEITQENETSLTNDDEQSDLETESDNASENKEIASLNAQRQWEKRKRHEAEGREQQLQAEIAELREQTAIPSEKDLSTQYSDWEFMDENTRNILTRMQELENKLSFLTIEKEKLLAKDKWENDFQELTQKNPELKNQVSQFKDFTGKEEYKNIPLSILSELYLTKRVKTPEYIGLEKNSSGDRKSKDGLSLESIGILRQNNPKEYMRLIKEKRLKLPRE